MPQDVFLPDSADPTSAGSPSLHSQLAMMPSPQHSGYISTGFRISLASDSRGACLEEFDLALPQDCSQRSCAHDVGVCQLRPHRVRYHALLPRARHVPSFSFAASRPTKRSRRVEIT
eukprot:705750-Rhodomonas_salina.9